MSTPSQVRVHAPSLDISSTSFLVFSPSAERFSLSVLLMAACCSTSLCTFFWTCSKIACGSTYPSFIICLSCSSQISIACSLRSCSLEWLPLNFPSVGRFCDDAERSYQSLTSSPPLPSPSICF
eukprot:550504-Hanusia_phi.AAC.1